MAVEILPKIKGHSDLVPLTYSQQQQLCREIREFLIDNVAKTGGHLAGNLGVVELSVALETVFDTASDRLVFDVGHQSYVHKLLTGRQEGFACLRQFGGLSGFPKPEESVTDAFVAGHASSSVSIALGMAKARTLLKQDYNVVALIGDGAATGGMAYEGLNNASVSREPMVIILNDNEMSIDRNVGGLSRHLSRIRTSAKYLGAKRWYRDFLRLLPGGKGIYLFTSRVKNSIKRLLIPATFFENMGITTLGPVSGSDLPGLIATLQTARDLHEPVLVHVITRKGSGYAPAEENPAKFHGIGKFDPQTGELLSAAKRNFSETFGNMLCTMAENNPKICAITAAMPAGTGLSPFMAKFPERLFDVGIAEEHAVSMAGGLAKQGMIPVVAVYSTFLQRAYDQMMQDIALLHLHVVFCVDRAGLVGDDGPTHHGVFDVGYLRQIPGMKVLAPASHMELQEMLAWAVNDYDGPVAIRYPRGSEGAYTSTDWDAENQAKPIVHSKGTHAALLCYGTMVNICMEAAEILSGRGIRTAVLRLPELTQPDASAVAEAMGACKNLFIPEEISAGCGICQLLAYDLGKLCPDIRVDGLDLGGSFVTHGDRNKLLEMLGLDAGSIADYVERTIRK